MGDKGLTRERPSSHQPGLLLVLVEVRSSVTGSLQVSRLRSYTGEARLRPASQQFGILVLLFTL